MSASRGVGRDGHGGPNPVRLRRIYEEPEAGDGRRVLIDGLWPRGVRKDEAGIDTWLREIAPSPELRRWFDHDPERYAAFVERYRTELQATPRAEAFAQLLDWARGGPLTLLTATRDVDHCHARMLADELADRLSPPAPRPAGYSKRSAAEKLGVGPGCRLGLIDPPPDWTLGGLPDDVRIRTDLRGRRDVTLAFVRSHRTLVRNAERLARGLDDDAALWIAWPRKAGGHDSDVTEDLLRAALLPLGLVDVKVAAIDADWSGVRFVRRVEHRRRPRPDPKPHQ